ncbi:hypothetical protein OG607_41365 [Streptomyces sp. NBC_01537]|uniref:hypothetical protein n=1 Tax=Streptomyces sp. NBC_01537 TaxID=2903896 RepID=UPI0038698F90
MHPVDGDVQVFAEGAHRSGGFLEVVVQVEPVVAFGVFGLLGRCLEEFSEAFQEPVGRFQDLVGELGVFVVGRGGVEPVGEAEDLEAEDVTARGVGGRGDGCRLAGGRGVVLCGQVSLLDRGSSVGKPGLGSWRLARKGSGCPAEAATFEAPLLQRR